MSLFRKRKHLSLAKHRARAGVLFALPFIVGFLLFYLMPLIRSLAYSFSRISISDTGMKLSRIGWQNYKDALFVNTDFRDSLIHGFSSLLSSTLPIILYSFFMANMLNRKFPGRTLARVIFFLPMVLNSGVMYSNMNDVFSNAVGSAVSTGAMSGTGATYDLTKEIMKLLPSSADFIVDTVSYIVSSIYTIVTSSGIQILVYLAALQSISPSLYEASSIEGATAWENFWKITLPMISPYILVNAVYTIIDSVTGLQNPIISLISNSRAVGYGLASAMSWIYLLASAAMLAVVYLVLNRFVYYENN